MFDYSIFRNDWEAKNFSYLERYIYIQSTISFGSENSTVALCNFLESEFRAKRENALSKSVQARADSLPKINEGNSHTRRN